MEGTIDEATPPDPRTDYALPHYASEQILRRSGIPGSILRPSNVYGMPGDLARFGRWALTPYGFPREAVDRRRIVLKSSGLQMRNFVAASGVADAASHAVARLQRTLDLANVAGNDTITMRDFAGRVADAARRTLGADVALDIPAAMPDAPLPLPLRFLARDGAKAGDLDAFLCDMLRALAASKES
jgi:UDP-glucose 4-epimerase